MEIVVRKADLLRELQLFQGIVERKNTIPILANIKFDAEGDQVRFSATDLETAMSSTCAATVKRPGTMTLPARKLFEIVKSLPETDVRIAIDKARGSDKDSAKVSADRFDSRIQTLPAADFPNLPQTGSTTSVDLPSAALKEMIAKTQFAITGEDTRYVLNGAQFILKPDVLVMVATDGHRLALITTPRQGDANAPEMKTFWPKKALTELAKLLGDSDAPVRYECGENNMSFQVGNRTLFSRLLDAQFPAYERVIPKGNDKRLLFSRDLLTNAVKRVALLSNERSRAVKFVVDQGKVDVTSSSPELGEAQETLMVDYSGPAMQICFNAQYVLDFLAVVTTDDVALELKDEVSQAVMMPVGAEGYEYTYVIMPMRV